MTNHTHPLCCMTALATGFRVSTNGYYVTATSNIKRNLSNDHHSVYRSKGVQQLQAAQSRIQPLAMADQRSLGKEKL